MSVPGIWISFSLCLCFSLLDNMNCSTTVGVVCVWFYVVVSIWMVSVGVWVVSGIGVWGHYYGFRFFNCLLYHLLFSSFDYWNMVVGVVRKSGITGMVVSVGVWMLVTGISGITGMVVEIIGISFGFRLGCSSSKKSENYEKFHGKRCGRLSGRQARTELQWGLRQVPSLYSIAHCSGTHDNSPC